MSFSDSTAVPLDTAPSTASTFEGRHADDVATGRAIFSADLGRTHCENNCQDYGWELAQYDDDERESERLFASIGARLTERLAARA